MPNRTRREDVVFRHPFALEGWTEPQPAGTYAVETEEELLEGLSFPAYRRVSTTIARKPDRAGALVQAIPVDPRELAELQAADRTRASEGLGGPAKASLPAASRRRSGKEQGRAAGDRDPCDAAAGPSPGSCAMLVRELMTTGVATVPPDTPVGAVVHLLADRGVSGVPVVDAGGALLGMVTEGDLLRRLALPDEPRHGWFRALFDDQDRAAERYARAYGATARDVMTAELLTVAEDATAGHAARLLEERKVRRLPVLRDGRLVGVVSRSDLLRALLIPAPGGLAATATDEAIRAAIALRMRQEAWASAPHLSFEVKDGVVEFHGFHRSDAARRAVSALAGDVPGVVRVVDHATEMPVGNVGLM
jgi:CBS domain-containing protein